MALGSAGMVQEPGPGLCLQWRFEGSSHLLVSEPIHSQPLKFSSSKVHITEGHCCTWVVTYCVWKEPKDRDGHDSGAGKYKTNALSLHPKVCLYILNTKMGRKLTWWKSVILGNKCKLLSPVFSSCLAFLLGCCDQTSCRSV